LTKYRVEENNNNIKIDFWDSESHLVFIFFIGIIYFSISIIFFNFLNIIFAFLFILFIAYFNYKINFASYLHLNLIFEFENNQILFFYGKNKRLIQLGPLSKVKNIKIICLGQDIYQFENQQKFLENTLNKENPFSLLFYFDDVNSIELGPFSPMSIFDLFTLGNIIKRIYNK
jgi:hypothetical protein